MQRRLTILIGAHKTASTHLQRSLKASRAALAPEGVGVIGPVPIGGDILPLSGLLRGRADPELLALAADGFLTKHAGDARDVILMNENILGSLTPSMLLQDNRFYKFAPGRLKRVLQLFPGHQIRVGMAIRNPASFLISAWQENMKGHEFKDFRDYISGIDTTVLNWFDTVKRMRQSIGNVEIFLWRYEDYPDVADAVLRHCIGGSARVVELKEGAANPGFSAAALDHLKRGGEVTKEASAEAQQRYPKGDGFPAFSPWSDAEMAAFDASYAASVTKFETLERVTLIRL